MREPPEILLVAGPSGSGKTTYCQRAIAEARARGDTVHGLLTLGGYEGDVRVRLVAHDLSTDGHSRLLAEHRRPESDLPPDAIAMPRWHFSPEALKWGDAVLAGAVPTDLLVVDELGPLEFERGQGWISGMAALDSGRYRRALVTVRPALLELARKRWPGAKTLMIEY